MDRPLRVALDASAAAVPRPTGVGRAIACLAAALRDTPGLALDLRYRLSRWRRRRHFLPGPGGLFHERWSLLLARRLDVFHGPDARLPRLAGPRLVATVHDLSARREGFASDGFRRTRERHWADVVRRADLVVTYTRAVREELTAALGLPPARLAVVPLAAAGDDPPPAPAIARRRAAELVGPGPFVLCLGERSRRKNPAAAVAALAAAGPALARHALVVAGPPGHGADELERAVERHRLGSRVRRLEYVDAGDVPALLAAAEALLFPSRYEGFGLPLLEAFRAGCPVVASRDPSLLEVAGGAALHADAEDPDGLGAALARLVEDPDLAASLRARGRAREARFTWARSAALLAAVYRAALAGSPAPVPEEEELPCSP